MAHFERSRRRNSRRKEVRWISETTTTTTSNTYKKLLAFYFNDSKHLSSFFGIDARVNEKIVCFQNFIIRWKWKFV
jgi:hypothetical protein